MVRPKLHWLISGIFATIAMLTAVPVECGPSRVPSAKAIKAQQAARSRALIRQHYGKLEQAAHERTLAGGNQRQGQRSLTNPYGIGSTSPVLVVDPSLRLPSDGLSGLVTSYGTP